MEISPIQDQIIKGSLLGSGFISGKSNPMFFGISETRNHGWLIAKGEELKSLKSKNPYYYSGKVLKWRSKGGNFWKNYFDLFYRDGKRHVEIETLNTFKATAFAVLYCDKGFWYSDRRVGLRTTSLGESNSILCQFFNEVNMPCEHRVFHGANRIIFNKIGTEKFLSMIAHRMPIGEKHKLKK